MAVAMPDYRERLATEAATGATRAEDDSSTNCMHSPYMAAANRPTPITIRLPNNASFQLIPGSVTGSQRKVFSIRAEKPLKEIHDEASAVQLQQSSALYYLNDLWDMSYTRRMQCAAPDPAVCTPLNQRLKVCCTVWAIPEWPFHIHSTVVSRAVHFSTKR
jgi:hypothetical protein